jgi:hypothetical protein
MPEVITDTSPIQYRYQIAQLDLLPTRMGRFRMPQAVAGVREGRVTIVLSNQPSGNCQQAMYSTSLLPQRQAT